MFEGLEDWRSAQQTRHRLNEQPTVGGAGQGSGRGDRRQDEPAHDEQGGRCTS